MTTTKISYTQQGDYLLPDLKLPKQAEGRNRRIR